MLSKAQLEEVQFDKKHFIQNGTDASNIQWIFSWGTNFDCYVQYLDSLNDESKLDNRINTIRTIIYAIFKPLQFTFFYWSILVFILNKFNFKKPVMKIILAHMIFRSLGDILDKLGDLMPRYYSNTFDENTKTYVCNYNASSAEMHPLRWVLTRQIGIFLWLTGEIIADWYPLIRTREIVYKKTSIWFVYVTCIIFNLAKGSLIILHFTLQPSQLYDEHGAFNRRHVNDFYFIYWAIQLGIIYASVLYDISIYLVLKKYAFHIQLSQVNFVKKFKTFSEYRIFVTMIISIFFLPLISIVIIIKFYYRYSKNYENLEFSFEEIRTSISNLQYFIIFIDQILLHISNNKRSMSNTDTFTIKNYNLKNSLKDTLHSLSNSQNDVESTTDDTLIIKNKNNVFEYSNYSNLGYSNNNSTINNESSLPYTSPRYSDNNNDSSFPYSNNRYSDNDSNLPYSNRYNDNNNDTNLPYGSNRYNNNNNTNLPYNNNRYNEHNNDSKFSYSNNRYNEMPIEIPTKALYYNNNINMNRK